MAENVAGLLSYVLGWITGLIFSSSSISDHSCASMRRSPSSYSEG